MSLFAQIRNRFSAPVAPATAGHAPARPTRPRRFSCATVPYILLVDESGSTSSALRVAGGRTVTRMQAIQDAATRYLRMLSAANPRQPVAVIGFTDAATVYHRPAPRGSPCRFTRRRGQFVRAASCATRLDFPQPVAPTSRMRSLFTRDIRTVPASFSSKT